MFSTLTHSPHRFGRPVLSRNKRIPAQNPNPLPKGEREQKDSLRDLCGLIRFFKFKKFSPVVNPGFCLNVSVVSSINIIVINRLGVTGRLANL